VTGAGWGLGAAGFGAAGLGAAGLGAEGAGADGADLVGAGVDALDGVLLDVEGFDAVVEGVDFFGAAALFFLAADFSAGMLPPTLTPEIAAGAATSMTSALTPAPADGVLLVALPAPKATPKAATTAIRPMAMERVSTGGSLSCAPRAAVSDWDRF